MSKNIFITLLCVLALGLTACDDGRIYPDTDTSSEGKTVVLSEAGRWVSLNGVFGNAVEWEKVKKEFGNRCAYCGKGHVVLIPEHIVPQSILGKVHPERVDLIENIVPSCSHCNSVKKLKSLKEFFEQEKDFTRTRLKKIQEHYRKYHIK